MSLPSGIQELEAPTCDDRLMWDIEMSRLNFPTLTVADELGLFPLLEKKSATAQEVAASLSLGARATEALLAVLTSLGLLVQHQGKFSNTEASRNYLLPESPYYRGDFIQGVRSRPHLHDDLRAALLKDDLRDHTSQWLAGGLDAQRAKEFTGMMHSKGLPTAVGVARRGDFSRVTRLLDVAGGSGCFCIALAMRYPDMRFTVLELPSVCDLTKGYVADYGLQDQIDTHAADMFNDPWPAGYDAIFFSDIFHDWDRERCVQLGKRSYEILPSGSPIYLHEMVLEDTKDGPLTIASSSMRMLMATQGKQYTASELDEILRECGFIDVSITPTSAYFSLVSATKP
jgi:hypothetical protein